MTNAKILLAQISSRGVQISLSGENMIRVSSRTRPPDWGILREKILSHKEELIKELRMVREGQEESRSPRDYRAPTTPRGTVVVRHPDGSPLAWEDDPPHIRLYAWALGRLHPGQDRPVDPEKTAKETGLTPEAVREALSRLVADGDLKRIRERRRELFRLVIRYE